MAMKRKLKRWRWELRLLALLSLAALGPEWVTLIAWGGMLCYGLTLCATLIVSDEEVRVIAQAVGKSRQFDYGFMVLQVLILGLAISLGWYVAALIYASGLALIVARIVDARRQRPHIGA